MRLIIMICIMCCFVFEASADWRKDPNAVKELKSSKTNTENCKKGFSKYLQEEWSEEVEKVVEKYKKSGMKPKDALARAEKDTTSWTKENSRINDKAESFCKSQNWSVGCKVLFSKSSKSGVECMLTPIDVKTRNGKAKAKTYPRDFG